MYIKITFYVFEPHEKYGRVAKAAWIHLQKSNVIPFTHLMAGWPHEPGAPTQDLNG